MSWLKIAVCALVFLLALGITLYPFVSNYLAEKYQSTAMAAYSDAISRMDDTTLMREREAAQQFNRSIGVISMSGPDAISRLNAARDGYDDLLNVNNNGIMGYIRIPAIDVELPIYHGVENSTLEQGVGHLPGSSLPVGGESTHAVLAAHSGLASQRMFTDLEQLREGDRFYLSVLGETLAYEIDQMLVVEPDDAAALELQPGMDLVTLITCTPYAVYTHRLLVRGKRVPYEPAQEEVVEAEAAPEPSTWRRQYVKGLALGVGIMAGCSAAAVIGWRLYLAKHTRRRYGKHEAR